MYWKAEPASAAVNRNGTANPAENTKSSKAPVPTVAEEAARVRTAPSTGPTQGVQPKAKVAPNKNELKGLPGTKREVK